MNEVLLNWDILKTHCHLFLRLCLIDNFLFFNGEILNDMFNLIIVCVYPLDGDFYALLDIFNILLFVRNVFNAPNWSWNWHINWNLLLWIYNLGSICLALIDLPRLDSTYKLSCIDVFFWSIQIYLLSL